MFFPPFSKSSQFACFHRMRVVQQHVRVRHPSSPCRADQILRRDWWSGLEEREWVGIARTCVQLVWHWCRGADLTEINLVGNNLTGTLPADLANIATLERINLNSNMLYGPAATPMERHDTAAFPETGAATSSTGSCHRNGAP